MRRAVAINSRAFWSATVRRVQPAPTGVDAEHFTEFGGRLGEHFWPALPSIAAMSVR